MDQKLNKEEIIKLISLYRSNEVLWNMSSKLYRRNDLKVKAYEDIGSQMGMPAEVVKKKIRSLRATYTGEKKKNYKRSGSGTEEVYQSSLFWFQEMKFLDNTIAVRSTSDNSEKNSVNTHQFEECIEENTQDECFTNKAKNKRVCGPREEENSNFDNALKKLMDISDKENEFTAFATSLAFQLQKLPEEDAYEFMGVIQNLLVQRKLRIMRERRCRPLPEDESSCYPHTLSSVEDNTSSTPVPNCLNNRTSTPLKSSTPYTSSISSDILSCAITNADIESEYEVF